MKKTILLTLIFTMLSFDTGKEIDKNSETNNCIVNAKETINQDYIFKINEEKNYYNEYGNYVVNGNYSNYSIDKLRSEVSIKDKVYIFYDLNLFDNEESKYEIMNNNAVIYYYINDLPNVDTFKSKTTNIDNLKIEIEEYINEKILKINNNSRSSSNYNSNDSLFTSIYSGSFREYGKPYGYIDGDYVVKKYRKNISSLYLIESHIAFTPGKTAIDLNATGYENYLNSNGYIKLKATQAQDDVGYNQVRYGGIPVFKDAYPVSDVRKVEINSSYSVDVNFGYSFSNGFSLDNITLSETQSTGLNIHYGYSKNYIQNEPTLEATKDPEDTQKYAWKYEYSELQNSVTHLSTGYFFEVNNSGHDLLENSIAFQYEYEMEVVKKTLFIKTYKTFSGFSYHNYI